MTPASHPASALSPRPADAPHTAQVIALGELHESVDPGRPVVLDGQHPLHRLKARLRVCLGTATMTLGELIEAREHQVFVLDHRVDQPVEMLLEGEVVARGQLVAVDDRFAVRITELPLPLTP